MQLRPQGGNRDHGELNQTQGQELLGCNPHETKTILLDFTTCSPVNPWQCYHVIFESGNHSGASAKVHEIFFLWDKEIPEIPNAALLTLSAKISVLTTQGHWGSAFPSSPASYTGGQGWRASLCFIAELHMLGQVAEKP